MSLTGMRQWLVVMVKEPVAGCVKTRLGQDIGVAAATRFYRHTTAAVVSRLRQNARWTVVLAISPDSRLATPMFAPGIPRVLQGGGDLGQRMQRIMERFPPGPVIIVGSDCPTLDGGPIERAFRSLGNHDGAIGPAPDGGYWLIGLRRRPTCPRIFHDVRWSTEHARQDTLRNMTGLRVAALNSLRDVDTGDDFSNAQEVLGRRILPPPLRT